MIFTQQLGTLEGKNSQEAIKSVANHLRRMQEELEYRLSVLDSSNINEIDAKETQILLPDGNLLQMIGDYEEQFSELEQTVEGFRTQVRQYESAVDGFEEQVSTLEQTVEGFRTQVSQYQSAVDGFEEQVSTLEQTVEGFTTTVKQYETDVQGYKQQVSTFSQTASRIETSISAVKDGDGKVTAASIVAAINGAESAVQISADHISLEGVVSISSNNGADPSHDTYQEIRLNSGRIEFRVNDRGILGGSVDYDKNLELLSVASNGKLNLWAYDTTHIYGKTVSIHVESTGSEIAQFEFTNGGIYLLDSEGYVLYKVPIEPW